MSVVLTVAPTGPIAFKSDNPALPTQPEEIAAAVERAYHLGASVAHIHLRDENDRRHVTREINPAAAWVFDGDGVPTRKFDGTCTKLDESGRWWARREVKPGKVAPAGFVAEESDPNTGKTVGWEPVEQSPFIKAFRSVPAGGFPTTPGTYELCGPKINGNPEGYIDHALIPHGLFILRDVPRDFDALAEYMSNTKYEGIVWHWTQPDGSVLMAKIKQRDFPTATSSAG